jgi:hypothetical protein
VLPEGPPPRPRPRDAVRFYVDEDILGLGYALMWMRGDVVTCGQPPFETDFPRGILDPSWIAKSAELGLIAITNNHKIRITPHEAQVAMSSGARLIGLAGKNAQRTTFDKARLLLSHWQAIETFIESNTAGPWWLSVNQTSVEQSSFKSL